MCQLAARTQLEVHFLHFIIICVYVHPRFDVIALSIVDRSENIQPKTKRNSTACAVRTIAATHIYCNRVTCVHEHGILFLMEQTYVLLLCIAIRLFVFIAFESVDFASNLIFISLRLLTLYE